jgi:hypothetical protein
LRLSFGLLGLKVKIGVRVFAQRTYLEMFVGGGGGVSYVPKIIVTIKKNSTQAIL